jgi:hypothetical protein
MARRNKLTFGAARARALHGTVQQTLLTRGRLGGFVAALRCVLVKKNYTPLDYLLRAATLIRAHHASWSAARK